MFLSKISILKPKLYLYLVNFSGQDPKSLRHAPLDSLPQKQYFQATQAFLVVLNCIRG